MREVFYDRKKRLLKIYLSHSFSNHLCYYKYTSPFINIPLTNTIASATLQKTVSKSNSGAPLGLGGASLWGAGGQEDLLGESIWRNLLARSARMKTAKRRSRASPIGKF